MIIWNNTIYIPTSWGGGHITITELFIDLLILLVFIIIGGYITKKMMEWK